MVTEHENSTRIDSVKDDSPSTSSEASSIEAPRKDKHKDLSETSPFDEHGNEPLKGHYDTIVQIFIELDEWCESSDGSSHWQERARWIKYEENFDPSTGRWGKPHVASLSFHSLNTLQSLLDKGTILLHVEENSINGTADAIVHDLILHKQIDKEDGERLRNIILARHIHMESDDEDHTPRSNRRKSMAATLLGDKLARRLSQLNSSFRSTVSDNQNGSENKKDKQIPPNQSTPKQQRRGSIWHSDKESQTKKKPNQEILKSLTKDAEGFSVLVGEADFLQEPICVFVRLDECQHWDNILEVPLPTKFLFLCMGPKDADLDYYDIGRCMATIMSTEEFQQTACSANHAPTLLTGMYNFLQDSIVLPPGDWQPETLLPVISFVKNRAQSARRKALHPLALHGILAQLSLKQFNDPMKRTGRLFGGMINDIKKRYPKYLSDIKDGLNAQSVATFFYMYFACLASAIAFGGLMAAKTKYWIGVPELLLATSFCGVAFSLFGGQPLNIIGVSGPMLLFEDGLFQMCEAMGVEYISTRVWILLWFGVIPIIFVAFDGSSLFKFVTRFTEEIFSALTSILFIYEAFFKLARVFIKHPLKEKYVYGTHIDDHLLEHNVSYILNDTIFTNITVDESHGKHYKLHDQPNTALISFIFTLATFLIAYKLKMFKNTIYFGKTARGFFSDFGIPIALIFIVLVNFGLTETYVEKLEVPDGLQPTDTDLRGWVINPMGMKEDLPIWVIFFAIIPAILGFILVFMETQVTEVILSKPERKLQKGSGFHLDILLLGILMMVNGILGMPLMTAAAVKTISHVNSLSVYSTNNAPGEKPHLVRVYEQRITNFAISFMIGVSVLMGPVLRYIPISALFGIFMYMGVTSTHGVQFFERLELFFVSNKNHPEDQGYVAKVRTWKMHLFTLIQLLCLGVLWAFKSTVACLSFPAVIVLLIPLRRYALPLIFSKKELRYLDMTGSEDVTEEEERENLDHQIEIKRSGAQDNLGFVADSDRKDSVECSPIPMRRARKSNIAVINMNDISTDA